MFVSCLDDNLPIKKMIQLVSYKMEAYVPLLISEIKRDICVHFHFNNSSWMKTCQVGIKFSFLKSNVFRSTSKKSLLLIWQAINHSIPCAFTSFQSSQLLALCFFIFQMHAANKSSNEVAPIKFSFF